MSSIGTGYDLSASQFSPDGRVFQVEYAGKAVDNSGTVIGIQVKDGVVLAVEKIVQSKLYQPGSNKRIFHINEYIGMACAGFLPDARQIVETARKEANNYHSSYGTPIPLQHLVNKVAMYIHAYTLYSSVRPFGVSVLLASFQNDSPGLYMIDPSGTPLEYYGCALGKAKQAAKTEIEKLSLQELTCKELVKEAAKIIYVVHDEVKDKLFELELSWVGKATDGKHKFVPENIFKEAEAYAKSALVESSDSEEEI